MAEYIEREAAYQTLTEYYHHTTKGMHSALREAISRVPAADVRPVRRGKWSTVYDDFMKSHYDTCSCCGKEYFGANGFNFCPNCGADMKEES